MAEQNRQVTEEQWGERCSVKLDMVLSRMDQILSMLFYTKGTLTVMEAALYLGMTTGHLYKVVRKYNIPHSRPTNGRIFFNKEDLDRWIKSRMEETEIKTSENELSLQEQSFQY